VASSPLFASALVRPAFPEMTEINSCLFIRLNF
jgi:hypothetical protein